MLNLIIAKNAPAPTIPGPYDSLLAALDDTAFDLCVVATFTAEGDPALAADAMVRAAKSHAEASGFSVRELPRTIEGDVVTITLQKRLRRLRAKKTEQKPLA